VLSGEVESSIAEDLSSNSQVIDESIKSEKITSKIFSKITGEVKSSNEEIVDEIFEPEPEIISDKVMLTEPA
jgi:glycine cleavage system H lipoate-binding protein